jgi:hypothetical protein
MAEVEAELTVLQGRLKSMVKRSKLSHSEIALRCGVGVFTISRWINHGTTLAGAVSICMAVGESPIRLFAGREQFYGARK